MALTIASTTDSPEVVEAALHPQTPAPPASAPADNPDVSPPGATAPTPEAPPAVDEDDLEETEAPQPGRAQRRITNLIKERTRLQVQLEQAQAERDAAMRLWQQRAAPEAVPALDTPAPAPPVADAEPDPNSFTTHAEYIKAISAWAARQEIQAAQARTHAQATAHQQATQAATQQQQWRMAMAQGQRDFEDFDQVLANPAVRIHPAVQPLLVDMVTESMTSETPLGPAVLHYLGRHPEVVEQLNAAPTLHAAARVLGMVEAQVSAARQVVASATTGGGAPAPVLARPATPAPLTPVTGASPGAGGTDLEHADYQTFVKIRNQQTRGR